MEPISLVATAWAPHNSPTRRAVAMEGVSTSIGTEGLSRATRRAVDPDPVKTVIARIETVSAIVMQAWLSASAVVRSGGVSRKRTRPR